MTRDQFQEKYHAFRTRDAGEALAALSKVDCEEPVVAVQIGGEYCLMLAVAAGTIAMLGIGSVVEQP